MEFIGIVDIRLVGHTKAKVLLQLIYFYCFLKLQTSCFSHPMYGVNVSGAKAVRSFKAIRKRTPEGLLCSQPPEDGFHRQKRQVKILYRASIDALLRLYALRIKCRSCPYPLRFPRVSGRTWCEEDVRGMRC